jgi:hypothetical protein
MICLGIGNSSGLLRTSLKYIQLQSSEYRNESSGCWLAEQLLASKEGLSTVELVNHFSRVWKGYSVTCIMDVGSNWIFLNVCLSQIWEYSLRPWSWIAKGTFQCAVKSMFDFNHSRDFGMMRTESTSLRQETDWLPPSYVRVPAHTIRHVQTYILSAMESEGQSGNAPSYVPSVWLGVAD